MSYRTSLFLLFLLFFITVATSLINDELKLGAIPSFPLDYYSNMEEVEIGVSSNTTLKNGFAVFSKSKQATRIQGVISGGFIENIDFFSTHKSYVIENNRTCSKRTFNGEYSDPLQLIQYCKLAAKGIKLNGMIVDLWEFKQGLTLQVEIYVKQSSPNIPVRVIFLQNRIGAQVTYNTFHSGLPSNAFTIPSICGSLSPNDNSNNLSGTDMAMRSNNNNLVQIFRAIERI